MNEALIKTRLRVMTPYLESIKESSRYYNHVLLHREEVEALLYVMDKIIVDG